MKPINKKTLKNLTLKFPYNIKDRLFFDPEKILRWFWKGRSCSSLPFLTKERKEKRVCGKPIILENSVKTENTRIYFWPNGFFDLNFFYVKSLTKYFKIEWNISKCIVFFGRSCCCRSKNNFEELWKYATSEITWGILKG